MTTRFDALDYAQRLERAGVPEVQAAVHAQVLQQALGQVVCSGQLATAEGGLRQELRQTEERLTAKIETVRIGLEAKIETVRVGLEAKIETVRVELEAKIEALRITLEGKIDVLRTEIKYMRWLIGAVIALNTAILVKMFSL